MFDSLYNYCAAQNEKHAGILGWLDKKRIEPDSVLDVGCGTGRFVKKLIKHYPKAEVLGLDYSLENIFLGREMRLLKAHDVIYGDVRKWGRQNRFKHPMMTKECPSDYCRYQNIGNPKAYKYIRLLKLDRKLSDFDLVTAIDVGPGPRRLEDMFKESDTDYVALADIARPAKKGGVIVYSLPAFSRYDGTKIPKEMEKDPLFKGIKKEAAKAELELIGWAVIGDLDKHGEADLTFFCKK